MVRQRSDRLQGLISPGALPVQLELSSVEGRPFSNEPQCTVGHRAGKNLERLDGNRCLLARVTSVEISYAVLRVVHRTPLPVIRRTIHPQTAAYINRRTSDAPLARWNMEDLTQWSTGPELVPAGLQRTTPSAQASARYAGT